MEKQLATWRQAMYLRNEIKWKDKATDVMSIRECFFWDNGLVVDEKDIARKSDANWLQSSAKGILIHIIFNKQGQVIAGLIKDTKRTYKINIKTY